MLIRIGVSHSPKEIEVDLGDDADADATKAEIDRVLADDTTVLWLTDKKGRQVGVPSMKLAYVEVGPPKDGPRIGFG